MAFKPAGFNSGLGRGAAVVAGALGAVFWAVLGAVGVWATAAQPVSIKLSSNFIRDHFKSCA